MNKKQLKYFEQKLLKEKDVTLKTLQSESGNGAHNSLKDYYSELSTYDNHPADIGSETYEMEMRLNLEAAERRHLEKIDNALEKINNGTYGICVKCGKDIEFDRLDIIPEAEVCQRCNESDISLSKKLQTRPVEEDILDIQFSRTNKDNTNFNGFDEEDTYQQVARFNKTDKKRMALDWYDNDMYDENISGVVEDVDKISEDYYKSQIENRKNNQVDRSKD